MAVESLKRRRRAPALLLRQFYDADNPLALAGKVDVPDDWEATDLPAKVPLLDLPPETPNALDDEFAGESLDAKWLTWNNPSSQMSSVVGDGVLVLTKDAHTSLRIAGLYQAVPSGACSFAAKMYFNPTPSLGVGDSRGGLLLARGTSSSPGAIISASAFIGANLNGTRVDTFTDATTGYSGTMTGTYSPLGPWYRVDLSADHQTATVYVSQDGVTWTYLYSWPEGAALERIGFAVDHWNAGGYGPCKLVVEWFRRLS